MTIGIDISLLARGTRTGIEEYTLNLLARLLPLDQTIQYKIFYNAFSKIKPDFAWLKLSNVVVRESRWPNRLVMDPLNRFLKLPRLDKLLGGADVFWSPHFSFAPVSRQCRRVITFHDLSFERFPEFFSWRQRFWHASLAPRARAKEADKIIAVSQSTKDDLVSLYRVPESKIRVTHSGVGEEFKKIEVGDELRRIKEKYHLPDNFILYFGTLEPRKNLIGLIRAYEILRQKNDDYRLVIAGVPGWLHNEIFQAARCSSYARDIIFTGFVAPEDKAGLYNLASLFVYPSFFEGFGFPPLEAMACGLPVICSNNSSFPETVGQAALMIDPYNFGEIAWAMNEVLSDNDLRQALINDGLAHVKKFSWDNCARETLKFLIE
jgi:glycosyltransferase involved in cell wall biosynthesis